jgi:hypothetical protein
VGPRFGEVDECIRIVFQWVQAKKPKKFAEYGFIFSFRGNTILGLSTVINFHQPFDKLVVTFSAEEEEEDCLRGPKLKQQVAAFFGVFALFTTPNKNTLTMFEKNLTSPQNFFLSLHWGFQDISLGVRFFFWQAL